MERILVVGGLSGIGKAATQNLKQSFLVETLSRTKYADPQIKHHSLDATDSNKLKEYFKNYPSYDHIVVTAAETPIGSLESLKDEDIIKAINQKLLLSYYVARDIPWEKSIILISGFLSARPGLASALQSAINAGIEGLTRAIAVEKAPKRANCISPGTINAGLWDKINPNIRTTIMEKAKSRTLINKVGNPLQIAQAIRFAIECEFLTGETIYVDGGARFGC